MSNGERIVYKYLKKHNYHFKYGVTCLFLQGLHADFLVHDKYNNLLIIEYDGSQHFKVVKLWGGVKGYGQRNDNDSRKNSLCVSHHIFLLRLEDMKDLSSSHYGKAKKRVNRILDRILPQRYKAGIDIRFVSFQKKHKHNYKHHTNIDAEQAILMYMTQDITNIYKVTQYLDQNDFYYLENNEIYKALIDIVNVTPNLNFKVVKKELVKQGHLKSAGGIDYLSYLFHANPRRNHLKSLDYYIKVVQRASMYRSISNQPYNEGKLIF